MERKSNLPKRSRFKERPYRLILPGPWPRSAISTATERRISCGEFQRRVGRVDDERSGDHIRQFSHEPGPTGQPERLACPGCANGPCLRLSAEFRLLPQDSSPHPPKLRPGRWRFMGFAGFGWVARARGRKLTPA